MKLRDALHNRWTTAAMQSEHDDGGTTMLEEVVDPSSTNPEDCVVGILRLARAADTILDLPLLEPTTQEQLVSTILEQMLVWYYG